MLLYETAEHVIYIYYWSNYSFNSLSKCVKSKSSAS